MSALLILALAACAPNGPMSMVGAAAVEERAGANPIRKVVTMLQSMYTKV
jgi:hypothetical protein